MSPQKWLQWMTWIKIMCEIIIQNNYKTGCKQDNFGLYLPSLAHDYSHPKGAWGKMIIGTMQTSDQLHRRTTNSCGWSSPYCEHYSIFQVQTCFFRQFVDFWYRPMVNRNPILFLQPIMLNFCLLKPAVRWVYVLSARRIKKFSCLWCLKINLTIFSASNFSRTDWYSMIPLLTPKHNYWKLSSTLQPMQGCVNQSFNNLLTSLAISRSFHLPRSFLDLPREVQSHPDSQYGHCPYQEHPLVPILRTHYA